MSEIGNWTERWHNSIDAAASSAVGKGVTNALTKVKANASGFADNWARNFCIAAGFDEGTGGFNNCVSHQTNAKSKYTQKLRNVDVNAAATQAEANYRRWAGDSTAVNNSRAKYERRLKRAVGQA